MPALFAIVVGIVLVVMLAKLVFGVIAAAIVIGLGVVIYLGAEKLVGKGR